MLMYIYIDMCVYMYAHVYTVHVYCGSFVG